MYSPKQHHIFKGVNGGRFAKYSTPDSKPGASWNNRRGRGKSTTHATRSRAQAHRRKPTGRHTMINAKSRAMAHRAMKASKGHR